MKNFAKICFLSAGIFLVACKKEQPAPVTYPTTHIKFNPSALEFVQIPVGRYFIYKDSATGSIDSVNVTQSIVENIFHPGRAGSSCGWLCYDPGEPDYYFEKYTLTISSANQDWFTGVASCDKNYSGLTFALLGHPSVFIDSNFNLSNAFWHPFTNNGSSKYESIPLIIIDGNTYTGVHQFISTYGQPTDTHYLVTIYYWVKGIGIIKRDIINSNSVKTSLLHRYGQN